MKLRKLTLAPLLLLSACAAGPNQSAKSKSSQTSTDSVSALAPPSFADRKMIKAADIQCTVPDVFTATTQLENVVRNAGGYVQESHLYNDNYRSTTYNYSTDSQKQVTVYTPSSHLVLRVPQQYVDSVVLLVPRMAMFIDHRTLTQSDVTTTYLSNELRNEQRLDDEAALRLAKKSSDAITATDYARKQSDEYIDRKVENMKLTDNVNYATVTVAFTQAQRVFEQVIVNADNYSHPPFFMQMQSALQGGWYWLKALIVVVLKLWPLWLLSIPAVYVVRKLRIKRAW